MVDASAPMRTYPLLVRILDDAEQVGKAVADRIGNMLFHHRNKGRPTVLGLAAGATQKTVYEALSRYPVVEGFSFSTCHTFNLDEYFPLAPSDENSLYHQVDSAISALNIPKENRHALLGDISEGEVDAHCRDYERRIFELHGIDFQLLGIGRNGHLAFNEPGSLLADRTRLVPLSNETKGDAASCFGGAPYVPGRALTMGIGTILEGGEIGLIALGEHKASIVKCLIDSPPNPSLPASYLKTHAAVTLYLDRDAARLLCLPSDVMVIR